MKKHPILCITTSIYTNLCTKARVTINDQAVQEFISHELKNVKHSQEKTSTIAHARHQEENPMRKKCLKAIVQEGHNICTSE